MKRFLLYVTLLVSLGVGVRLLYYGLETIVASSPYYYLVDIVLMLMGGGLFLFGIITGVRFLSPPSPVHR